MPLGIQQNNNFAQIIVDIWNDKVFYQEQEFPAGFMAASILNISDSSDAELVKVVCGELNVSAKVAGALIKEYQTLCGARQFGDDVFSISCGSDPAVAYDRMMRRTLLMQRMEEVLTPRELNLVRSYLGIGQPDEVGMTFQELAIRLNYNGPSGAEKAYKVALRKLKKDLYGRACGRWRRPQGMRRSRREHGGRIRI